MKIVVTTYRGVDIVELRDSVGRIVACGPGPLDVRDELIAKYARSPLEVFKGQDARTRAAAEWAWAHGYVHPDDDGDGSVLSPVAVACGELVGTFTPTIGADGQRHAGALTVRACRLPDGHAECHVVDLGTAVLMLAAKDATPPRSESEPSPQKDDPGSAVAEPSVAGNAEKTQPIHIGDTLTGAPACGADRATALATIFVEDVTCARCKDQIARMPRLAEPPCACEEQHEGPCGQVLEMLGMDQPNVDLACCAGCNTPAPLPWLGAGWSVTFKMHDSQHGPPPSALWCPNCQKKRRKGGGS